MTRYSDRVAIVTGAGRGIGRQHALALAAKGAKVVVNDIGARMDGQGASTRIAELVVEQITAAGGVAIANFDSVATEAGAQSLIETAVGYFGRVDILVNNAGILRDHPLEEVSLEEFLAVINTHVVGSFLCSRAAWPIMKKNQYGRVIMTSSASGLYGTATQASYCSAKMAVVGLMHALSIEGREHNILVNTVCPMANSRMTDGYFSASMESQMLPEFVSPLIVWLCSEECQQTNSIISAGMGYFARASIMEGSGIILDEKDVISEKIGARFVEICDQTATQAYLSVSDYLQQVGAKVAQRRQSVDRG
jgi:NAD(P)-dependent dehydrogenase (short-subunit alcohol dehydrogenase family)